MSLRTEVARWLDPGTYTELPRLRETLRIHGNEVERLTESFASLQQIAREDRDWVAIGQQHSDFFQPEFIKELIRNARVSAVRNPIVARGVALHGYYVYGRGVEIRIESGEQISTAPDDALQGFLAANPLLSIPGLQDLDRSMRTDGNVFYALFTDALTGGVDVRTIDALEIHEIVCNPDDAAKPWFYLRCWTERRFDQATGAQTEGTRYAWYPALGYDPPNKPATLRGYPVQWGVPVLHDAELRIGKQSLGIPPVYAALDPAKTYRRFLGGWSALQDIYRSIAFDVETKGGQRAIDAKRTRLETTRSSTESESNPTLQTGSAFIHGPGQKLTALKTAGATTGPDEGRALFLFAIMSMGFPEHMYGDPSTGNLATAKTLDRPTELMVMLAQERAKSVLERICTYALSRLNAAPARADVRTETAPKVIVKFPPPVEHDIPALVGAMIDFYTLRGNQAAGIMDPRTFGAMILQLFGVADVNAILDPLFPPETYDAQDWAAMTPEERQAQAEQMADRRTQSGVAEGAQLTAAAQVAEVGRRLLEALPRLNGHA